MNSKLLKKIIREEKALLNLRESPAEDMNTQDVSTVAEYLVDFIGGNLNDTLAVKDFFVKNGITDLKKRTEILKSAGKIIKGQ